MFQLLIVWSEGLAQNLARNKCCWSVIRVVSPYCRGKQKDCSDVNKEWFWQKELMRSVYLSLLSFWLCLYHPVKVICLYLSVRLWVAVMCGDAICRSIGVAWIQTASQMYSFCWCAHTHVHTQRGRMAARICLVLPPSLSFCALMSHTRARVWPTCGQREARLTHTAAHTDSTSNYVVHQNLSKRGFCSSSGESRKCTKKHENLLFESFK